MTSTEAYRAALEEVRRYRRKVKALSIYGVPTRDDTVEAAARKATVDDLAPHCTKREIASFLHVSEATIAKDLEQVNAPPRYPSDDYHRVIPIIEPVRDSFRIPPMPIIPQGEVYREPAFAF